MALASSVMTPAVPVAQLRAFARVAARLLQDASANSGGSRSVRGRAGAGLEFLDHRDYQPGDELRRVDWHQSARRQKIILRRFQTEASSDWYLCLDASSSMCAGSGNKWTLAVQCACAMAYVLLDMGHRVGLLHFAEHIVALCPLGRGARHFMRVTQTLQSVMPAARNAGSQLGVCLPRLRGRSNAFVFSDFLMSEALQRDLMGLRSACTALHALQIGGDEDTSLPGAGHVSLVDCETGQRLDAVADVVTMQAARSTAQQRRDTLRHFCASRSLPFSSWDSADHWRGALLGHLGAARRT
jgi:uncharacterized protein (DUF58 family)